MEAAEFSGSNIQNLGRSLKLPVLASHVKVQIRVHKAASGEGLGLRVCCGPRSLVETKV